MRRFKKIYMASDRTFVARFGVSGDHKVGLCVIDEIGTRIIDHEDSGLSLNVKSCLETVRRSP